MCILSDVQHVELLDFDCKPANHEEINEDISRRNVEELFREKVEAIDIPELQDMSKKSDSDENIFTDNPLKGYLDLDKTDCHDDDYSGHGKLVRGDLTQPDSAKIAINLVDFGVKEHMYTMEQAISGYLLATNAKQLKYFQNLLKKHVRQADQKKFFRNLALKKKQMHTTAMKKTKQDRKIMEERALKNF
eukprot:UN24238